MKSGKSRVKCPRGQSGVGSRLAPGGWNLDTGCRILVSCPDIGGQIFNQKSDTNYEKASTKGDYSV